MIPFRYYFTEEKCMDKLVTIDGPSGVGKGTISRLLAKHLGWEWLDSGALYRLTALHAQQLALDLDDPIAVSKAAQQLPAIFEIDDQDHPVVLLGSAVVTDAIRSEQCGNNASKIAAYPKVREALLQRQRDFLTDKGLVADGRDMGTVVFPDAPVKIFLTASAEVRAQRRFKQLQHQGVHAHLKEIQADIEARDLRDRTRAIAPLVPAEDAEIIDTSETTVEQVFQRVFQRIKHHFK